MTIRTIEPHRLLLRYPEIDAAERTTLINWLRSLDARTLVRLLADTRTETKLLAVRNREPELQHHGITLGVWLLALLIVVGIAAASVS
jgi:hypothetical protein